MKYGFVDEFSMHIYNSCPNTSCCDKYVCYRGRYEKKSRKSTQKEHKNLKNSWAGIEKKKENGEIKFFFFSDFVKKKVGGSVKQEKELVWPAVQTMCMQVLIRAS